MFFHHVGVTFAFTVQLRHVVVGVAQLAAQENGAREDYLQHGLQKDLHLVRVYSGRSSYL